MSGIDMIADQNGVRRVYCRAVSKEILATQLDAGFVLTDIVPHRGVLSRKKGVVAYFRAGTEAEIADCREQMRRAPTPAQENEK